jgi:hypothetical protein
MPMTTKYASNQKLLFYEIAHCVTGVPAVAIRRNNASVVHMQAVVAVHISPPQISRLDPTGAYRMRHLVSPAAGKVSRSSLNQPDVQYNREMGTQRLLLFLRAFIDPSLQPHRAAQLSSKPPYCNYRHAH